MIGFSLNRWMRVSWLALREMGDLQEFTMAEVREPRARVSIETRVSPSSCREGKYVANRNAAGASLLEVCDVSSGFFNS
jgi:hypothetical protein